MAAGYTPTRRRGPAMASVAYDLIPYSAWAAGNVVEAAAGNITITDPGDGWTVQVAHDGGASDDEQRDLGLAFDATQYVTSDGYCMILAEIERAEASITSTDRATAYAGLWDGSQTTSPLAAFERNMNAGGFVFGQVRNTGTGTISTNNNTALSPNEPTAAVFDIAFGDASRVQQTLSQQCGLITSSTKTAVLDPTNADRTLAVSMDRPLVSGGVAMQRATVAARAPAGVPRIMLRVFADGGTARTWRIRFCAVPAGIWRAQPFSL